MTEVLQITIDESGNILVWDPICVEVLRQQFRIFGKLIGTVARAPHKTTLKGLPLKLGFEELVTLLKENYNKIDLVASSSILSARVLSTSNEIIEQYKNDMDDNYNEICSIITEEKIRKTKLHFENLDKLSHKKRKTSEAPDLNKVSHLDIKSVLVHLPTATPIQWLRQGEKEKIHIPDLITLTDSIKFVATYYKEKFDRDIKSEIIVKSSVFYNLWTKGYSIVIQSKKMGGDYLLYPGDPWINHATHVVRIFPSAIYFKPSEWISSIRLISSLKKICLFAWYNEDAFKQMSPEDNIVELLNLLNIRFHSLTWCGRIP